MISTPLKRLRNEEIILQIMVSVVRQNITPAQIF
jgi:hypothetical protein